MTITLYDATVPSLTRAMKNISAILDKAAAYCEARKVEPSVLLGYRLAADMYPLGKQVQILSDLSKGVARLAGVELPSYPDTEQSFDELKARLAKTIDFINSIPADQINGTEDKEIVLKFGTNERRFTGLSYALGFMLPNVYFHSTAAYAILRHIGLDVGKRDFMGV